MGFVKNIGGFALLRAALIWLLSLTMAACGGGGGSPGATGVVSGGNITVKGTITLSLVDTTGVSKNSLSPGSPLIAKATVKDSKGKAVPNTVVTFTVSQTDVATISPSVGTALTDADGVAQISIEAGSKTGASDLTAKAKVGEDDLTASIGFTVGASSTAAPAAINFVEAVPDDKSIVIKGAGGNGRTEVALVTFSVVDSGNNGIPNKKVNFTLQSNANDVTLVSASGFTGLDGRVSAAVNSGASPTTVRVIATVDGTAISTLSDTITVTTGQPVQQAFSISVGTFNISGWNHDNETSSVNILMADQFGNPVADGTPVVFQTDSGSIGSSSIGGCLTDNGGCSVVFRSQNPRYGVGNSAGKLPGVATITVSSTSSGSTLTGQAYIILSGDQPYVYLAGTSTEFVSTGMNNLSITSCAPQVLSLDIVDLNGNIMPAGTTVASADTTDIDVTSVSPSQMFNSLSAPVVSVSLKPDATACAGHLTGYFTINIKAPLSGTYSFPFAVKYP